MPRRIARLPAPAVLLTAALLAATLPAAGCAGLFPASVKRTVALQEVALTINDERQSTGAVRRIDEPTRTVYAYQDERFRFEAVYDQHFVELTISNRSDIAARIDWDASRYVTPGGDTAPLGLAGRIKALETDRHGRPVLIEGGNSLRMRLARRIGDAGKIGATRALFDFDRGTPDMARTNARAMLGQRLQVVLVLTVRDTPHAYTFAAELVGVTVDGKAIER